MESMSVRPEQVNALASQIRQGANNIRGSLDKLEADVTKLRGGWSGEAQVAYDQAQLRWNKSLAELQQLLAQIASKTEEISSGYVNTDNNAAKRFG